MVAVLAGGRMLPEIGAAQLRVAVVAGLVDAQADQQGRHDRPVRVVAVTAGHLLLSDGMTVREISLGADGLVASVTHLRLSRNGSDIVMSVHEMAVCAHDVCHLVGATLPMMEQVPLYASVGSSRQQGASKPTTSQDGTELAGTLSGWARMGLSTQWSCTTTEVDPRYMSVEP